MQHQKLISQWHQQQPEKYNLKAKANNFKNVNDSNRRNINYSIKSCLHSLTFVLNLLNHIPLI